MSNVHTTLFQNSLYWCLDLIRHNIGTQLKLNKYIFDISIPFCHHLYLSATLKQCFTEFAYLNPSSIMFTCRIHTCDLIGRLFFGKDCKECVDWSVILRIEIVGNLNMT